MRLFDRRLTVTPMLLFAAGCATPGATANSDASPSAASEALASGEVQLASVTEKTAVKGPVTWEDILNEHDTPEDVLMYGMGIKGQR